MNMDRREGVYGKTILEWISDVPGELPTDAVGLWQILAAGQSRFDLTGAELAEYIRLNLVALLDAGAIPVSGGKGTDYEWIAKHEYGTTREEIIAGVIAEWQASNGDEMYPWSVWFALPREGSTYIKI